MTIKMISTDSEADTVTIEMSTVDLLMLEGAISTAATDYRYGRKPIGGGEPLFDCDFDLAQGLMEDREKTADRLRSIYDEARS